VAISSSLTLFLSRFPADPARGSIAKLLEGEEQWPVDIALDLVIKYE